MYITSPIHVTVKPVPEISATIRDAPSISASLSQHNINVLRGTYDYDELDNKPRINDVTLTGNKSFEDLGIRPLTNMEILEILRR